MATTIYSGIRTYGTSVLLPLTPANNYDPRVIIMGGGSPATATTEIIDLGPPPRLAAGSQHVPGTRDETDILPTGRVPRPLGGSVTDEDSQHQE